MLRTAALGVRAGRHNTLGENKVERKILYFIAVVFFSLSANAANIIGEGVSKSTFINRIDSSDDKLDARYFAYIQAGARILLYDKTTPWRGSERRLVLTESGIWGYIKEKNYWDNKGIYYFKKNNLNTFISRQHNVLAEVSSELSFRITFTRGEVHKFEKEDEDTISFQVSDSKNIGSLPRSLIPLVTVPRKNAKYIDYDKELTYERINDLSVSVIDGISGIKKRCNTEEVTATKKSGVAGGTFGFDISKFFASLSIKAGVEVSKTSESVESFKEGENVTRKYFTRNNEPGLYKLTKIKGCSSLGKETYIFTPPDNQEIIIDETWARDNSLNVDTKTGQVLITCADQYFRFYDNIFDQGIQERDIPFLISQTAKFKKLDSECY
jgi:hypothetical protein